MCYGQLFLSKKLAPGTYIFSDLERLDASSLETAAAVHHALSSDSRFRVLNHPLQSLRRFELLTMLSQQGINSFNAYRLEDQPRPKQFPVFIRGEDDHKGSLSDLLPNQQSLDQCSQQWQGRIGGLGRKLVIEHCDVSDAEGVVRKYSAFIIGGRFLPRHLFFARHWCVKGWQLLDERYLQEERDYIASDPHQKQLANIFQLAGIDFGRIDYGIKDGRVQVWEINTNPMLPVNYGGGGQARQSVHDQFNESFIQAMRDIDCQSHSATDSLTVKRPIPLWKAPTIPARVIMRRVVRGKRTRVA